MKIMITGLCFQGNKGGPAIALSLKTQLDTVFNNPQYIYSVPGASQGILFSREQKWAGCYEVEVVENFSHIDFLKYLLRPKYHRSDVVRKWFVAFKSVDLVLDMTAISYVGPPLGKSKRVLLDGRFRYFLFSRILKVPFLAWTQSYGPFSNFLIRKLARWDLSSLPAVYCRGRECENLVKELLPQVKTFSFPDVAVTLPLDVGDAEKHFDSFLGEKIITISPSAVLYSRAASENALLNDHVQKIAEIARHIVKTGCKVLFVPHTLDNDTPSPVACDRAVCSAIVDQLKDVENSVALVEDDYSPLVLKYIISKAYIHLGARYHSVVASLSTGVPSIALSWHHKYRDLMEQYGVEAYVADDHDDNFVNIVIDLFESLANQNSRIKQLLMSKQIGITDAVEKNVKLLAEDYASRYGRKAQ